MDLEILNIASNTKYNKVIKNCTHSSKCKSPICGDVMEVYLKIINNKILDFGYQCKACIYCQASVSLLSTHSINKSKESLENLIKVTDDFFDNKNIQFSNECSIFKKLFNKKNISRKECLKLPFIALSKALKKKYE